MLHTQAGRLRHLVDDLQAVSRAEARQIPLSCQMVAPQDLVQQAIAPLAGQFTEKGLALQISLPADLPEIAADPARAVQILTNPLVNALRYTPAPGKVELIVSYDEDRMIFRIRDTGVGLTEAQLAHIFERFYRTDLSRARASGG